MGWTGTHKPAGQSLRDFFTEEFRGTEILDFSVVNYTECYAAMRNKRGEVFGMVILVHMAPQSYWNVTYKEMGESMGPFAFNCPKRILDLLDTLAPVEPTPDYDDPELVRKIGHAFGAYEWRQRCRQEAAKRREVAQEVNRIQAGDCVVFKVRFGSGHRFEVTGHRGRSLLARGENGLVYRVGPQMLAQYDHEVERGVTA